MQSLERVVQLLSCFSHDQTEVPLPKLFEVCAIPQSTGYKLLDALVREGLLVRPRRGVLALGPAVGNFFFTPIKALAPPSASPASMMGGARVDGRSLARMVRWNPNLLNMVPTTAYRKNPPFVLGFSNASTSNLWRVALERSLVAAAQRQRDVIAHMLVRNAHDDALRQIAHLEEMRARRVDLCIFSAAASDHPQLQQAVQRLAEDGIPVIGVDRICGTADDLVCFVTAPDVQVGHVSALWLAEFIGGRGRILMLCGRKDASPCYHRLQAALEIFGLYPDIHIEAIEYTNWEMRLGQEAVARHLTQGTRLDGVWCDSGLQGAGSLRAFIAAGYRRGTIPPHTGGEVNLVYKLVFQNKVPLCGVNYPAAMGALSVQAGLETLFGRPVPRRIEANMEIVISRGHETASVKADLLVEEKVRWDREDDYIHASGWIPGSVAGRPRDKAFLI